MTISAKILTIIQEKLNVEIVSNSSVSGGCIADSRILEDLNGKRYFLKTHVGSPEMFLKEANGLKELAKAKCIRVPEVLMADEQFLLLENIATGGKSKDFFEKFGEAMANLHRFHGEIFGFAEDNYIGANPQYNIPEGEEQTNWAVFYYNKRILPQVKMAEAQGYGSASFTKAIVAFEKNIEKILNGSEELPTLLHGDLWGGNYMCDTNGQAVLIDPAVYYGHREADLAMTKMFGGFSPAFYKAYQATYPLKDGWEHREQIYLLYHYLNHLNLFGTSYLGAVERILKYYLK